MPRLSKLQTRLPAATPLLIGLLLGLLITSASVAHAADEKKDPSKWDISAALGFNLTDGNSDTVLLNLNAKASRDYQKNIWRFELDGNYGETSTDDPDDDETTQEDFSFDGEYKRLLTDRFYVGLGSIFLYDDIADVDYRVTLKPLVGYFLIKEDDLRLNVDVGPSYVFEKVGDVKDDYFSPRIANRFEWDISKNSKFFQSADYSWDVSDTDNYIVNAEAGLEAALSTQLSLVVTVKDSYDNQPAADREKNDLSVISGLKVAL